MRNIALSLALGLLIATPALAQDVRAPAGDTAAPPPQSPAGTRSDRLDQLLAKLHQEAGPDALSTEHDIWELWMASDSPTAEVLLQQATRAMNKGEPEAALTILNRLIGAYPDFAEAWNKRATLYFMMGKDEASLADIDKVLELEPRHFGALSGRGMIYQRQKKYSAALAAFQEALAINPNMQAVKDAVKAIGKIEQGI